MAVRSDLGITLDVIELLLVVLIFLKVFGLV